MTDAQLAASLNLNTRQLGYARRIVAAVKALKLPGDQGPRAADIALATGLVESNLTVYANGNNPASLKLPHDAVGWDHGSVGIFQQQVGGAPNSTANWGTAADCMNVEKSTQKFVAALRKRDWLHMSNGAAAQAVQGSAFPDRYAQRDAQAIRIRKALWSVSTAKPATPAKPPAKPAPKPKTYTVRDGDNMTKIAKSHSVSLAALKRANPKAGHPAGNFDIIHPGDVLRLP